MNITRDERIRRKIIKINERNKVMDELIKVKQNSKGTIIVSARDLYLYLTEDNEFRHFGEWAKRNIELNKMSVENTDYQIIPRGSDKGRKIIEYACTLDFAKELCMFSQTEKGKTARLYFIECEKKLKRLVKPKELSRLQILQMALESEQGRLAAEAKVLELKPDADYARKVLNTDGCFPVSHIAKELGVSARKLNQFLNEQKVIFKVSGQWLLYAEYQNLGYTRTREHVYGENEEEGIEGKTNHLTVWTELGRRFIHDLVEKFKS